MQMYAFFVRFRHFILVSCQYKNLSLRKIYTTHQYFVLFFFILIIVKTRKNERVCPFFILTRFVLPIAYRHGRSFFARVFLFVAYNISGVVLCVCTQIREEKFVSPCLLYTTLIKTLQ